MAAGAAPYVAGLIKSVANGSEPARIALHTLASAVLVKAQGGNAAAGAARGFVAASGSAALSLAFYNKKPEELSPDEKTVIVNLVAALGAAGGGMAAGNSTGIGSGANAARVEVENNYLSGKEPEEFAKKLAACGDDGSCRANVMKEMAETSNKNIGGFSDCLKSGDKACINDKLSGIKNATGYDALTAQIGSDAANTYKEGLGVETFNNAIDCIGMGWEACSNKKGWKLIESGLGVLIIAGGQTIGGKLAEAIAGSKGNANTNIQPGSKQPVQIEKLNQKQENAIRKIDNSIKNGLKYHDIAGSLKDMDGNPVPKPGGGYWDHLQEMQNTL
ncbi:VENN motif pre-toxin domain-containing protein [Cronobacter dublinensis]